MSAVLVGEPVRPRFEEIYLEFFPRIYAFLLSRLRHRVDAEDVTAQIFVKAFEAYPRYRPHGASPSAWLFTIARNASLDQQCRAASRERAELAAAHARDSHPDPVTVVEQRRSYRELRLAVRRLPARQRAAVAMRLRGLTFQEVSRHLGCSKAAAKMLHRRALLGLRRQIS